MEDGKIVMINILYEDNHLLVAVKPIGVLSQADGSNTEDMLTLLKQYLKVKIEIFRIFHQTQGLIIVKAIHNTPYF